MSALGRKARGLVLGGLAAATLSAQAWAYPGCNILDIINDAGNTIGGVGSPECVSSFASGGGAIGVGVITGVLSAAALSGAGGGVDALCGDLNSAMENATNLAQWLNLAGGSANDVASLLNSLQGADPLNVALCACTLEQGVDSLVSDLGDCLCDLANLVGLGGLLGCNTCTPPPPAQANCALPANCYVGSPDPACQASNVIAACPTPTNTGGLGGLGNLFGGSSGAVGGLPGLFGLGPACPASVQNGPTGAFASTTTGNSNCPQVLFCFCPKPLVPTWTTPPSGPPPGQCTSGSCFGASGPGIFTCACPPGTSQSGVAGGLPVCRCPYTGVPPVATDHPSQMCPPVNILGSCQPNQVVVNGKCVTPCSDPSMGMTPDGACCDPNLMTSCGECCKSGTIPVNGTCVAPGTSQ